MKIELAVIATVVAISTSILNQIARALTESKDKGATESELKGDIKYIRERVDDVYLEYKDQRKNLEGYGNRLSITEANQKRIKEQVDKLEVRIEAVERSIK